MKDLLLDLQILVDEIEVAAEKDDRFLGVHERLVNALDEAEQQGLITTEDQPNGNKESYNS